MQIQKKLNPSTIVTIDGDNSLDLFKQLAHLNVVFNVGDCGACGSSDIFPQWREGEDYHYPEMVCSKCFAKLTYGISKQDKGSIYPKKFETDDKGKIIKKDGKAVPIENRGWVKYNPQTKE